MSTSAEVPSLGSLEAWITAWVADELGVSPEAIKPDEPFLRYRMNSLQAMMLVGDLEGRLGLSLPPTLAWDHPSISALARHLVEQADGANGEAASAGGKAPASPPPPAAAPSA